MSVSTTERSAISDSLGLREHSLSGLETLAQSISSVAPTAGPAILIPLVYGLAGNGAWLSYILATAAVFVVALNISSFASYSASPGSLYAYSTSVFTGEGGQLSAWALLFAYVATASAVTGGFVNYAQILLAPVLGKAISPALLAVACVAVAIYVAYRDVKISARMMLWFEVVSVTLILIVIGATLWGAGPHIDTAQLQLKGVTGGGIRLGLVLAIFSFVGFESATTLGTEAKNPLRTIPRAVVLSAILSGGFFALCAYTQVLGFARAHQNLAESNAPLHLLADRAGMHFIAPLIDVGAAISFFACVLSCITAGARVAFLMGHRGLAPGRLTRVHSRNETPHQAIVLVGLASLIPPMVLLGRGVTGTDVNGWMGTLATYGFITAYLIVSVALPVHLHRHKHLTWKSWTLSSLAVLAMVGAFAGSLYPFPPPPTSWFVLIFAVYLSGGYAWSLVCRRRSQIRGSTRSAGRN